MHRTTHNKTHRATRTLVLLLLAVTLFAPGGAGTTASLLQDDAESGSDAPDSCVYNDPSDLHVVRDGTFGQIVPIDDPKDVYTLVVGSGESVDVVQDLASADDSTLQIQTGALPHAPHIPQLQAAHDDTENPFAVEILDRYCSSIVQGEDPGVLPRTFNLDTAGVYQVVVYESPVTLGHNADGAGPTRGQATEMCHPPCMADGYRIDVIEL